MAPRCEDEDRAGGVPRPQRRRRSFPGSDPKLKGEYVAIGAHNDHVGLNNRAGGPRLDAHLQPHRPSGRRRGLAASRRRRSSRPRSTGSSPRGARRTRARRALRLHLQRRRRRRLRLGERARDRGEDRVAEGRKPKRSILFVWHVGEEKGLLGSAYFTDHPTVPRDSIVAQLNMDMVGRGDAWDVTGQHEGRRRCCTAARTTCSSSARAGSRRSSATSSSR